MNYVIIVYISYFIWTRYFLKKIHTSTDFSILYISGFTQAFVTAYCVATVGICPTSKAVLCTFIDICSKIKWNKLKINWKQEDSSNLECLPCAVTDPTTEKVWGRGGFGQSKVVSKIFRVLKGRVRFWSVQNWSQTFSRAVIINASDCRNKLTYI